MPNFFFNSHLSFFVDDKTTNFSISPIKTKFSHSFIYIVAVLKNPSTLNSSAFFSSSPLETSHLTLSFDSLKVTKTYFSETPFVFSTLFKLVTFQLETPSCVRTFRHRLIHRVRIMLTNIMSNSGLALFFQRAIKSLVHSSVHCKQQVLACFLRKVFFAMSVEGWNFGELTCEDKFFQMLAKYIPALTCQFLS